MLSHLAGDNEVVFNLGRAFKELGLGKLGCKSQRGQRVHNHVNPEELDSLQGRLLEQDGTHDSEEQRVHVHGKLELQEALNVVVDVSTPGAGLHNRIERIVLDDDVSGSQAHLSTGNTHAEADVGLG
jgi:hypothetical protein